MPPPERTRSWIRSGKTRRSPCALRKSPAFAIAAIVILAVGIGLCTTVFTVVDVVIRRPLPYPDPDRLVMIWDVPRTEPGQRSVVAPGDAADWRDQTRSFDGIAVFNLASLALDVGEGPQRVPGAAISSNYFDVLQVQPRLGRGFLPTEERVGASRAIVISHGLWQRHFSSDPSVIGRTLKAGSNTYLAIGVMPAGFEGPEEQFFGHSDFWIPLRVDLRAAGRGGHYLRTIARLRPSIAIGEARSELRIVADRVAKEHPETNASWSATVIGLQDQIVGDVRPALLLLLVAVGLVQLAICANLASLLASRGAARRREFAIRAALGAGQRRLIQVVTSEAAVLAVAGAVTGIAIADWTLGVIVQLAPALPHAASIHIDASATTFAFMLAVTTVVLFSLAPALKAARIAPWSALLDSGQWGSEGRSGRTGQRLVVIAEVAVSVMLLIGASLLGRSFMSLVTIDPGFSSDYLLTARLDVPSTLPNRPQLIADVVERARAVPGVESAGLVTSLPLYGLNNVGLVIRAGTSNGDKQMESRYRAVTPDYFRTIGTSLRAGRLLNGTDSAAAPHVAVINDVMARQFGSEDPLGHRITVDFGGQMFEGTVVGVVGGVRQDTLTTAPDAEFYVPYDQHPVMSTLFLAVRSHAPTAHVAPLLRAAVRSVNPGLVVENVAPMRDLVERAVAPQRLNVILIGVLCVAALVLASIGLYAVVAQGVSRRTREIGIRMALGARSADVVVGIVMDALKLAMLGVAAGAVAAFALSGALSTLLFGVGVHDALTFGVAPVVLVAVACLASYLPARRAARIDPLSALRHD